MLKRLVAICSVFFWPEEGPRNIILPSEVQATLPLIFGSD